MIKGKPKSKIPFPIRKITPKIATNVKHQKNKFQTKLHSLYHRYPRKTNSNPSPLQEHKAENWKRETRIKLMRKGIEEWNPKTDEENIEIGEFNSVQFLWTRKWLDTWSLTSTMLIE